MKFRAGDRVVVKEEYVGKHRLTPHTTYIELVRDRVYVVEEVRNAPVVKVQDWWWWESWWIKVPQSGFVLGELE